MADRYWVGGSGTWDATTTTNWATASGGAGGASAPTSADNVIFDASSNVGTGAFTVTVAGTTATPSLCNDFSTGGSGGALDGVMTLTMSSTAVLDCYGSFTIPATNFAFSNTSGSALNFKATATGKTFTTNGITVPTVAINFNGAGGEWTLGSALTAGNISVIQGSLVSGNYNITYNSLLSSGTATRSISLGSSTLTGSGSSPISFIGTGLTWNAGTSTINCSGASPTFSGAGLTYYNVSFTSTAIATVTITGANTYNNLTFAARAAAGMGVVNIGDNQTVSGTLTLGSGTTGTLRLSVQSSVVGTPRTLTVATLTAPTDVDFRDITAAGASSPWSGTRLGNCLGNTNITFGAGKTVYWNLAAGGNYNATAWATSSGGTVATSNYPLPQDTAIIENTGLNTGATITLAAYNTGTINMSTRSNAVTLAHSSANTRIYGNLILSSAVTTTATTGGFVFNAQGVTQQITTAGAALAGLFIIENATGTVQLQDNCTVSNSGTAAFGLTSGTLDLNEFNLSIAGRLANSGTLTRSIDFGSSGKIYLTYNGGATFTILNAPIIDNFTIIGTSYIEANGNNTAGARTFSLGATSGALADGSNSPNLYISAGTDTLNIASYVKDLNFTGFSGTFSNGTSTRRIYGDVVLSSTMTFSGGTASWIFDKTSGTQTVTTNGVLMDCGIAVGTANSPTLQLLDNLTMGSTRTFNLSQGTLDLSSGNRTLSCGIFTSSNSATRSIAFGTGSIDVTGNATTVWTNAIATGFSYTGTPTVNLTYAGSTGGRTLNCTGNTEANAVSFNVLAGGDSILPVNGSRIKNFIFDNVFTGSATFGSGTFTIFGNLTLSTNMTVTGNTTTFGATSGSQLITTNSINLDFPITQSGVGGTVQLQDNLTIGVLRTFTLTNGTLDINDKVLSTGLFSSSNSNTRSIDFGLSGQLLVTGTGTAFNAGTSTGLSIAGTGAKISMNSPTAKTFAGGSFVYPVTLEQSGLGNLTITGANTFDDMTNTVQPCTIIFPASTTTSFKAFNVNGTEGNLVSLRSSSAGTRCVLAKV